LINSRSLYRFSTLVENWVQIFEPVYLVKNAIKNNAFFIKRGFSVYKYERDKRGKQGFSGCWLQNAHASIFFNTLI